MHTSRRPETILGDVNRLAREWETRKVPEPTAEEELFPPLGAQFVATITSPTGIFSPAAGFSFAGPTPPTPTMLGAIITTTYR
jgi:hypothetical protein